MKFQQLIKSILKQNKKDDQGKISGARYKTVNPFNPFKPFKPFKPAEASRSRVGVTRADKKLSKRRRKMAKMSRRINRSMK